MVNNLAIWTIYDSPRDYPGLFVARLFLICIGELEPVGTGKVFLAETLEGVRNQLPPGLYRMPRDPSDEPAIVESWL
jgi:hypothetical protein